MTFGAAATTALLRVGSRIDVLGPDPSGSGIGVVAANVRVVAIPAPTTAECSAPAARGWFC